MFQERVLVLYFQRSLRRIGPTFAHTPSIMRRSLNRYDFYTLIKSLIFHRFLFSKGYIVSILNTSDQAEDVPVCVACAQAMRGKYRLTKINPEQKFTCAIGKSRIEMNGSIVKVVVVWFLGRDLKFQGPFHCLNHKVDLTRNEAENTLFQRQEQLEQ